MVFLTSQCLKYMPFWLKRWQKSVKAKKILSRQELFRLTQFMPNRSRNIFKVAYNRWNVYQQSLVWKRKQMSQNMPDLFSQRVLAAVEEHGFDYNSFMRALRNSGIELNRKALSYLAIYEPASFKSLVDVVKTQWCEEGGSEKAKFMEKPSGVITRGMLQEFTK